MAIYRIISITSKDGLGETKTVFRIQKRLGWMRLGAWVTAPLTCHYYTHDNYNKRPCHGALLTTRYFDFASQDMAERVLAHLKKPIRYRYKNNLIIAVLHDDTLNTVYINKSYYRDWDGKTCYEFAKTAVQLEREIDERTITKTVMHVG